MKKTYHGSRHCKAVTFEVDLDLDLGTAKCNCAFCWKQRMWVAYAQLGEFRLLSGEDNLADYDKAGEWGESHHRFCARCGTRTHGHGRIEAMGGPFVSVMLASLDDLPVDDLVAAPLRYMDGLHDDWEHAPAETRHL